MVFQCHFRCILYLVEAVAEGLSGCRSRHGAGNTDLCLASALCAGDGGIALCKLSEQSGHAQASDYLVVREFPLVLQVIENCRKYTAGSAGRSGNYYSVIGILLAASISI